MKIYGKKLYEIGFFGLLYTDLFLHWGSLMQFKKNFWLSLFVNLLDVACSVHELFSF